MKWKAPHTETLGFTDVYDADGHRADVIRLLQGGLSSADLIERMERRRADGEQIRHTADGLSLTDEEVREIRTTYRLRDPEYNGEALAARYGVTRRVINDIINGFIYREVRRW